MNRHEGYGQATARGTSRIVKVSVHRPLFEKGRRSWRTASSADSEDANRGLIAPVRWTRVSAARDDRSRGTYDHVEVTREQPVLEHTAVGDVDPLALVRDDDHRPAQGDVAAKVHVAGDGQMVELDDLGDLLEPLLELLDLLPSLITGVVSNMRCGLITSCPCCSE